MVLIQCKCLCAHTICSGCRVFVNLMISDDYKHTNSWFHRVLTSYFPYSKKETPYISTLFLVVLNFNSVTCIDAKRLHPECWAVVFFAVHGKFHFLTDSPCKRSWLNLQMSSMKICITTQVMHFVESLALFLSLLNKDEKLCYTFKGLNRYLYIQGIHGYLQQTHYRSIFFFWYHDACWWKVLVIRDLQSLLL